MTPNPTFRAAGEAAQQIDRLPCPEIDNMACVISNHFRKLVEAASCAEDHLGHIQDSYCRSGKCGRCRVQANLHDALKEVL